MPFIPVPKQTRRSIAVIAITLGLLILASLHARSETAGNLQVSFINVGQGDSALLQDPNGFDVLIDGGIQAEGDDVLAYLRAKGVTDIDVLVDTHPDADHVGGLVPVLLANDIPVRAVVYNGYPGTSQTWQDFVAAVAAEGLTPTAAHFPDTYQWGVMTANILNPVEGLTSPEPNDASLVVRVDYGDFNVLFTGDIDTVIEAQVLSEGTPVAAEVLKVAHHGSEYGSSAEFLSAAAPRDSIISVGENNYGHPNPDTVQRIRDAGSRVWRTDRNGSVLVVSDGVTYTLSAEFMYDRFLYLPMLLRAAASTTPTVPPPPTTGDIRIETIFYDGIEGRAEPDEYVVIKNADTQTIEIKNWTLRDSGEHVYTFPSFQIKPNQTCRVYTNQDHPETCGFNYKSSVCIWNNTGDCASLRNAAGVEVDSYCY